MEKKYYDIIASLIEKNDKFIGCEPILEDIIQDVYDHSKIVLGSVTNEDVIIAYLNKVVATSLITVPKKLNFNIKNKHKVISNVQAITNINIQNPPSQPELSLEEEFFRAEETEQNNSSVELEIEDLELNDEIVLNEVSEPEVEETIESIEIEEETPNQDLDLSIENDLEQFVETDEIKTENEDILEVKEESFEIEDSNIEEETVIEEDNTTSEFEEVEMQSFDLVEEPLSLTEEPIEEAITIDVDKNLVDQMINGVSAQEEQFEVEPEIEEEVITFEDSTQENLDSEDELSFVQDETEELTLAETESFDLSDNNEDDFLQEEPLTSEIEEEEVVVTEPSKEVIVPDYSCFNYEPEVIEISEDEICSDLKEYSAKYPEKKLLEVCRLKYKENRSVSEIAELLDFTEETVIEVLNDIIELVKD